jgi:4-hydroxybenzoate polyprenyltransferase
MILRTQGVILLAGIKTLPVRLGRVRTLFLLTALHLTMHLCMFLAIGRGLLAFEPVIPLYSFIAGMTCIACYYAAEAESERRRRFRVFLVDGESTVVVCLRALTGF